MNQEALLRNILYPQGEIAKMFLELLQRVAGNIGFNYGRIKERNAPDLC